MIQIDHNKKIHEQITEATWSSYGSWQDADGNNCCASEACRACMVEWINLRYGNLGFGTDREYSRIKKAIDMLYPPLEALAVSLFNDKASTKFADVLAVLKLADV